MEELNIKEQEYLSPDLQLILFTINQVEYAVNIKNVVEVIKIMPLTILPEAPRFIKGVVNLRGKVVPIMDLRQRFGIDVSQNTKKTSVIIVRVQNSEIGIIVDSVIDVLNLHSDTVEPSLPVIEGLKSEFVDGVAKAEKKLIVIINIEKIFTSHEKLLLKEKFNE
ncbi:MAG: chemotaxis protein CheW [bacterium]|nr:chemotaxis protein CheW [bacterium]